MRETFNLSVCRQDKHAIQTQSVIHCAHHRWKHRRTVSIGVFQRQRELFLSHITDGNTDEHKPSVYYRGEGNCSNITDGNTDDLCPSVFFKR